MAESVKIAADVVLLTIHDNSLSVLLVTRGKTPFKGQPALPGGFLEHGETVEVAAQREFLEETGLTPDRIRLDQIGVYSDPKRDPRSRVVSVAFSALIPKAIVPSAGGDASDAHWISVAEAMKQDLAFDHHSILQAAVEHARHVLEHSAAAAAFCEAEFTMSELRRVYEIIWDVELDAGNFHRKVAKIPGFVEPVGRSTARDGGRPATLYRADPNRRLSTFLTQPSRETDGAS